MRILFVVFILAPILEMWLLIEVGSAIGALPTIACVVLTAMAGAALLRQQGVSTLLRARQRLDHGEVPAREMLEGMLLAIGGVLLLTPGFITDALGLVFLLRPLRGALIDALLRRGLVQVNTAGFGSYGAGRSAQREDSASNVTIEGEYRKEE